MSIVNNDSQNHRQHEEGPWKFSCRFLKEEKLKLEETNWFTQGKMLSCDPVSSVGTGKLRLQKSQSSAGSNGLSCKDRLYSTDVAMACHGHHQLNEHELQQTPRDSEGQGSLVCYSSWGHKELDTTQ